MPADVLLLCVFLGVDQRLHTSLIGALTLEHVDDVESVSLVSARVGHFEEVPLCEALSAVIILHEKIIFEVRHFDGSFKVPRLESAFKDERVIELLGF